MGANLLLIQKLVLVKAYNGPNAHFYKDSNSNYFHVHMYPVETLTDTKIKFPVHIQVSRKKWTIPFRFLNKLETFEDGPLVKFFNYSSHISGPV